MRKPETGNGAEHPAPAEMDEPGGPQGLLERTLAVIELLARNAKGLPLFEVADTLRIPRSATHRVLNSLIEHGYVRQERYQGSYLLTAKIASLGFLFLAGTGVTDLAQPVIERLARSTGELVRFAVLDGHDLTFVAKAQGSPHGLRYDPDMGQVARLSCSASGLAWLSHFSDEQALAIARKQGFGSREEFGPKAPQTDEAFLKSLRLARKRGYGMTVQTYATGMAAIAVPVRHSVTREITATVNIAGPHMRLTEQRMQAMLPLLQESAQELSQVTVATTGTGARQVVFTGIG